MDTKPEINNNVNIGYTYLMHALIIDEIWDVSTGKSETLLSGLAPSSPQWSGATPALLLTTHLIACPSHVLF